METTSKSFELLRFEKGLVLPINDYVSIEEPLEIQVIAGNGSGRKLTSVSVTMRSPGNDDELATGFLFTEGIIQKREDVLKIESVSENIILIHLHPSLILMLKSLTRNFYTTSSCGVCGKASIEAIRIPSKTVNYDILINASLLKNLNSTLFDSQENFQSTGGLHASALFDKEGTLILLKEDVGRHNALDKLIGNQILKQHSYLQESILLVSGRASFELVQKAAVAGIQVMAAIGAPSSLAIELANEKGITLIGFLKSDRFNIYTHKNRINLDEQRRI